LSNEGCGVITQSKRHTPNTQGMDMRFLITMNMPSAAGNFVHQMNAEYPVDTLEGFVDALTTNDFVVVEEFYKDPYKNTDYSRGFVAINHRFVGKIKVLTSFQNNSRKELT
jgi:hypothetical protein